MLLSQLFSLVTADQSAGLTSLTIPESVTTLGEKAFANQKIESVVLPETLTTLGTYIFMDCIKLKNVRVECAEVPQFCFTHSGLTSLTLSHNVKTIGSNAFNYTPLQELTYEGSLALLYMKNALSPILVNVLGKLAVAIFAHRSNTLFPIAVIPSLTTSFFIFSFSKNGDSPIS